MVYQHANSQLSGPLVILWIRHHESFMRRVFTHFQVLISPLEIASFNVSTRVLVWPIGLDMVEVASSNLAGPTKYNRPGIVPGFSYLAQR